VASALKRKIHGDGWAEVDQTLVLDDSGRLLDFAEVSDVVKRETSSLPQQPTHAASSGAHLPCG
jgi:hypothetical protein